MGGNAADLRYFEAPWPEAEVPPNCPVLMYWEVDPERDVVLRTFDVFADGGRDRRSVDLIEQAEGRPCASVVECDFMPLVMEHGFKEIAAEKFEEMWRGATNRAFVRG